MKKSDGISIGTASENRRRHSSVRASFTAFTAAMLLSSLVTGCGSKDKIAETIPVPAETAQSESQTSAEDVTALVESAPDGAVSEAVPQGSGDPQELRTDMVTVGKLTVDAGQTTYENELFSATYYSDDFTIDDTSEPDTVTIYYMGDAKHEPSVRIEYLKDTGAEELRDDIRLMSGEHELDSTGTISFYDKPVSTLSIRRSADDGLTDYYLYYVFEYGSGSVQISCATYLDDADETLPLEISDAIAMLFDTMQFKDPEGTSPAN